LVYILISSKRSKSWVKSKRESEVAKRLGRYQRAADYPPITISKPEHQLLEAIARFGYISASQLTRLLYAETSKTFVQLKLEGLYHHAYVERIPVPPTTARGGTSLPAYTLDRKGWDYLKGLGLVEGKFKSAEAAKEPMFLRHSLSSHDLLILTHSLAKSHPRIELARFETEAELKAHPVLVTAQGEKTKVMPDGWVELHIDSEDQVCLALELDRNTIKRGAFTKKVAALIGYSQGMYQKEFGTESLTIAWVAALGGERRLKEMIYWTEVTLSQIGASNKADMFRFAAFDPAASDPSNLVSPIWFRPFGTQLLPLFELEGEKAESVPASSGISLSGSTSCN
jgi:hypothetical protein